MAWLPRAITSRSIAFQVFLLVLASLVLFHFGSTVALQLTVARNLPTSPELDRFVGFVKLLDNVPPGGRSAVAEGMNRTNPTFRLALGEERDGALTAPADKAMRDAARLLGLENRLFVGATDVAPDGQSRTTISASLLDGRFVTANLNLTKMNGPPVRAIILGSLAGMLASLAVLLWWASRALTAPLGRFARAAASFSLSRDATPLDEDAGPEEIRVTSRALNHMQARIRRMVEDRTRMLAAVSHDLRTPITRMRLRVEFLEDKDIQRQMLRDLDQMAAMTHAALAYLRDGPSPEKRTIIELSSLLQTVCDDLSEYGADVVYKGPDRLVADVRSQDLARTVTNLVENAIKYANGRVKVVLRSVSNVYIEIDVVDGGLGIPDDRKTLMLKPFARGNMARTMSEPDAGFGLGLPMARATAEALGGTLALLDAHPSGLIARLSLPIRTEAGLPVTALGEKGA